jgi:hypothetical protein
VGEVVIVIGVLLMTAFVFAAWLCVRIGGFLLKTIFGIGRPGSAAQPPPPPQGWSTCRNPGCRGMNPEHARFCRRCGSSVDNGARGVQMRYVA